MYRNLRENFTQFNRPTERTICNVVKKFERVNILVIGDFSKELATTGCSI